MKERYFDLMEKVLGAYTDEHIKRYFDDVKRDGVSEHGFPRLVANMGILIANGRCTDLTEISVKDNILEICCKGYRCRYISSGEITDTGNVTETDITSFITQAAGRMFLCR